MSRQVHRHADRSPIISATGDGSRQAAPSRSVPHASAAATRSTRRGCGADEVLHAHDDHGRFAAALHDEALIVLCGQLHDLAEPVRAMWASMRRSMVASQAQIDELIHASYRPERVAAVYMIKDYHIQSDATGVERRHVTQERARSAIASGRQQRSEHLPAAGPPPEHASQCFDRSQLRKPRPPKASTTPR